MLGGAVADLFLLPTSTVDGEVWVVLDRDQAQVEEVPSVDPTRRLARVTVRRDVTVPTDRGPCPGNGSMVAALRPSVGIEPTALGKPEPYLYQQCATRMGLSPSEILAVGDRLDTDVVGANRAKKASCLLYTSPSPRDRTRSRMPSSA